MEPSGDMKNKESRVGNMAVRDEIIKTLEENRGTYLAGEQLAAGQQSGRPSANCRRMDLRSRA